MVGGTALANVDFACSLRHDPRGGGAKTGAVRARLMKITRVIGRLRAGLPGSVLVHFISQQRRPHEDGHYPAIIFINELTASFAQHRVDRAGASMTKSTFESA